MIMSLGCHVDLKEVLFIHMMLYIYDKMLLLFMRTTLIRIRISLSHVDLKEVLFRPIMILLT